MILGPKVLAGASGRARIRVLGETFEVPAGVALIRVLQYLQYDLGRLRGDWGGYCFNDTDGCCECELQQPDGAPYRARACVVQVTEGLIIRTLPPGARLVELTQEAHLERR